MRLHSLRCFGLRASHLVVVLMRHANVFFVFPDLAWRTIMDSFVALFYLVQLVLILVFLRKVVDLLLALVVFPFRFDLVVVLIVSLKVLDVQLLLVSFHVVFWF